MKKWLLRGGCALGLLTALGLVGWSSWPRLLEGWARQKVEQALGRRFQEVQMGCFELRRESLHICDLSVANEDLLIELDNLDVEFELGWRFATITSVISEGGKVVGEFEALQDLQMDGEPRVPGTPSRVRLEGAELHSSDLTLDITHRGYQITAALWDAQAESPSSPANITLDHVVVHRGDQVKASIQTLETLLDPQDPFPLDVDLRSARIVLSSDLTVENVGGTITLQDKLAQQIHADLKGETAAKQGWSFLGDLDRKTGLVSGYFVGKELRLWDIPGVSIPQAHLNDPGWVSVDLHVKGTTRQMQVYGSAQLKEVAIQHPRLAPDPVVFDLDMEILDLTFDLDRQAIELEKAYITPLGLDVLLELEGSLENAGDPKLRRFAGSLLTAPTACQSLLEAVPRGLIPGLEGFELSGKTSVDVTVNVDFADPDATVFEGGIDIDKCRLLAVPPEVRGLSSSFTHVVRMPNGRTVTRLMGPGAPYFAPIEGMPVHVHGAVVATEDNGFWHHDGFLEKQIKASLRQNVETGEFKRGGSTITMQMVKNVLLSHQKTVSRKVQELFLTWVIERQLSKDRIMELYLNAVEFGPGIYGIGHAAQHYFGKQVSELTSLESAFLATLLPRPVERHEMWCRGAVTEKHALYVHKVHLRMLARHVMTKEEFDEAELLGLVFDRAQWQDEESCLTEGWAVRSGHHVQEAVTGLLSQRVVYGEAEP